MAYLTAKDVAGELAVSLARAYEIMRECTRLVTGRSVRVSREDFETWKRAREQVPVPTARRSPPPPTTPRSGTEILWTGRPRRRKAGDYEQPSSRRGETPL